MRNSKKLLNVGYRAIRNSVTIDEKMLYASVFFLSSGGGFAGIAMNNNNLGSLLPSLAMGNIKVPKLLSLFIPQSQSNDFIPPQKKSWFNKENVREKIDSSIKKFKM